MLIGRPFLITRSPTLHSHYRDIFHQFNQRATSEDQGKTEVTRSDNIENMEKVKGHKLFMQSTMALFRKRLAFMRKNIITTLMMILIPFISTLLLALTFQVPAEPGEVPIRLNMHPDPQVFYSSKDADLSKYYEKIVESSNGKVTKVETTNISQAILDFGRKNLAAYRNNLIAAATFEFENPQEIKATAFFPGSTSYSLPITMNLVTNTIMKKLAGEENQIDVSFHKLPKVVSSGMSSDQMTQQVMSYTRVVLLIICLFPTLALYVIHPLKEASCGMKGLQRMTGVTSYSYWGTFFLFDFFVYIISIILLLIGLYYMDVTLDERQFYATEICIMFLLLALFSLNTLPIVYIFSFLKKKSTTVITILSFLPLVISLVTAILPMVVTFVISYKKLTDVINDILNVIFMLIPTVSFFNGLLKFITIAGENASCRKLSNYQLNEICASVKKNKCCDLKCWDGVCEKSFDYFGNFEGDSTIGESVLYLCLTPLIYFTILGLLEHKIISKIFKKKQERMPINNEIDDQVKTEKLLVASEINKLKKRGDSSNIQGTRGNLNGGYSFSNLDSENSSIYLAYELSKYYGSLPAVKEISFSVKKSECFGLLGVNGAGKSTTFRMLTGEEFPDSGLMYLNGKEHCINRREYLAQMGYCPQNHALINSLNSEDHLRLFASLRGVPRSQVSSEVKKWISRLNLNLCANQPSGTYSGGNKRRLSIAIALIGNPNLVLLDEPTTGVDPAARRSLWHVIKSCQLAGQSIILTSHSMEECEALCNRLVIMVRGQLVCIGPSEQLKQRFGAGYDINIKLNPERINVEVGNIKHDIENSLECELRDEHMGYLTYHVTNSRTKWQTMYGVMKNLKEKYNCIEDFSVLSATLEQLFLQFAKAGSRDD